MSNVEMTQAQTHDVPRTNGVAKLASISHTPRSRTPPAICYTLRRKVNAFLNTHPETKLLRDTQAQVRLAMGIIDEALQRYGREEFSLAYNGGKDCLVLLVLILACLPGLAPTPPFTSSPAPSGPADTTTADELETSEAQQQPQKTNPNPEPTEDEEPPQPLQAIYIAPPDPFPEVEAFVATSTKQYHLDLVRYSLPMRRALEAYLGDRPAVRAIFMGTRRTDPHSEFLRAFSPTDADWPQFMRVNPLLDWHYAEIWTFIRQLDLSFCCLYEQGFSSLGGMTNTRPNPALALDTDAKTFRPAYELVRDDEERLGRDR
ncbi:putative FAD synthetase [Lasiosphaeria hispida]|uniref:FAD synthase n=1 Tax=Lasiosphaeria hispida TaxID=260671 RepID=A0AAJ0MHY0_9PEZI|nr:putative FAD synthetase [Lasiosphaeria hispida]